MEEGYICEQYPETKNSIFRAPADIRYGRGSDFEPKLVSIGPYYHGRQNLEPMEDFKLCCMSDLKKHSVGGSNIDHVDVPVDPFMRIERYARDFYKEKFDFISEVDFVRMLVLDSCFIIRIIFFLSKEVRMAFLDLNIKDIRSDLLLLENQIPLFFIQDVYNHIFFRTGTATVPPFLTVLKPFIFFDMPWSVDGDMPSHLTHLLHVYWLCCMPAKVYKELTTNEQSGFERDEPNLTQIYHSAPKVIPNATELNQMVGIKFEKFNDGGVHVIFSNGIMRMSWMKIDSSQKTLLVNLIAFERSVISYLRIFTTYIKFMDELINSQKDVELLQQCGIIYNTLSSHKMAAGFINDIGNFCLVHSKESSFFDLSRDVLKYYESNWNRRWTSLRNNYFNSPWAGISVFAGVLLLFLSAVQTYCTAFPTKK